MMQGDFEKTFKPKLDINNVSFIVNSSLCGPGGIKCTATHTDGTEASVYLEYLEDNIFRLKVFPRKTGGLRIYIVHVRAQNQYYKKKAI